MAAFIYEYERYREHGVAIFGVTPQTKQHVLELRERTLRDARFDQPAHKNHDAFWSDPQSAFPLTLVSDPQCVLSGAVGAKRDQHWSGAMVHPTTFVVDLEGTVRWAFQSKMAQRRPSPVRLAAIAGAVAKGQTVPEYVEE